MARADRLPEPSPRGSRRTRNGAPSAAGFGALERRGPADQDRHRCDRCKSESHRNARGNRPRDRARRNRRRRGTRWLDPPRLRLLDAQALHRRSQDRCSRRRPRSLPGQRMIRQVTDGPHINHPTYFLQSSFFPGDREMFFTSYRTGDAQLFEVSLESGETRQLTQGQPIHPYSPALHPDGERIVVTRGGDLWWVHRKTLEQSRIFASSGQLGECSISADGMWLTAAYKMGGENGLVVCRFDGSSAHSIPFPRTVI